MDEEQKQKKMGAFPFVVGGLSFIPLVGVLFGIVAIAWGLLTKKSDGKKLAIIGACGIAFTVILYSSLFYFGFVKRGGIYDDLRVQLAESTLDQVVQAIEFYKMQNGNYPDSLKILKDSLPANSMIFVHDATDIKMGGESRYYHYELIGEDHYYLLGVGPDGRAFTPDDILPKMQPGQNSKIGLLIKQSDSLK